MVGHGRLLKNDSSRERCMLLSSCDDGDEMQSWNLDQIQILERKNEYLYLDDNTHINRIINGGFKGGFIIYVAADVN